MRLSSLRIWIGCTVVLLVLAGIFYWLWHQKNIPVETHIIVLSPHFDDAVLSLGGLLSQSGSQALVATFFRDSSNTATTTSWNIVSGFTDNQQAVQTRTLENDTALAVFDAQIKNYSYTDDEYPRTESNADLLRDISKDIQALIASYGTDPVAVYGPSDFGTSITHPDHELIHQAFLDVARGYTSAQVRFFMYEDYPYIERFNKESVASLQKHLEEKTGIVISKKSISLTSKNVSEKIKALQAYLSQATAFSAQGIDIVKNARAFTETRCGKDPKNACEVIYEIVQH